MVKTPVEYTLAAATPEMEPNRPDEITAIFAGPPCFTSHPAGQVGKELTGPGGFHERPENNEQCHKSGGDPGNGTENTGIRDQELHFNDFRQRDGFGIKHARQVWGRIQVHKKPGDQKCHGRHHCPADRFQKQQDHDAAQKHFNGQDLIHKFQAFRQPLMKIDDIQRGENRHRRQYPVDEANAFVVVFFSGLETGQRRPAAGTAGECPAGFGAGKCRPWRYTAGKWK